jgi:hypothetical protein
MMNALPGQLPVSDMTTDELMAELVRLTAVLDIARADWAAEMMPITNRIAVLTDRLQEAALAAEITLPSRYGSVVFRKGYGRKVWDGKGLEDYAKDHPEILRFLRETPIEASAVIKFKMEAI